MIQTAPRSAERTDDTERCTAVYLDRFGVAHSAPLNDICGCGAGATVGRDEAINAETLTCDRTGRRLWTAW